MDYGTTNPLAAYSIYDDGRISRVEDEYYFDSKEKCYQKTDKEYGDDLEEFMHKEMQPVSRIIMDPSAASFKVEMRRRGYVVKAADNEVLEGIRLTSSAFFKKILIINKHKCPKLVRELHGYIWDAKAADRGVEQPVKLEDHGCDAIRYFVATILKIRILRGLR